MEHVSLPPPTETRNRKLINFVCWICFHTFWHKTRKDMNSKHYQHHLISAVFSSVATTSAKQAKNNNNKNNNKNNNNNKSKSPPKSSTPPLVPTATLQDGIIIQPEDDLEAKNNTKNDPSDIATSEGWITVVGSKKKSSKKTTTSSVCKTSKNTSTKSTTTKKNVSTTSSSSSLSGKSKMGVTSTKKTSFQSNDTKPSPSFLSIMGYSSSSSSSSPTSQAITPSSSGTSKRKRRRPRRNNQTPTTKTITKKESQYDPKKQIITDLDNITTHTATTASCCAEEVDPSLNLLEGLVPEMCNDNVVSGISIAAAAANDDHEMDASNDQKKEEKKDEVASIATEPSLLLSLPYDILTGNILSYLRPEDMISLGTCNTVSKQITEDGFLWQNLFRERFPQSSLTPQAMEEWKLAYQLTLSKVVDRLRCYYTKHTFFEDVVGVGLDFTVNPKTKHVDYINVSQDLVSDTAFTKHKIRSDVFGNTFQLFLPLYFSEDHFQRALPQIQKTILRLCRSTGEKRRHSSSSGFQPSMVLDVFPKIITTFVVLLSDEGVSASRKSFTGLIRIHRLFLALAHQYPTIKGEAIQRLQQFVTKEENRSKTSCPGLGAILPLLMIVDQQDFNWAKIRPTYLDEMFDRAVLWVCKEHPQLEKTHQASGKLETTEQGELRVTLTRSAMTVVLRLTMFHAYFLEACCQGSTQDRSNKYDCFFGQSDPDDNPSKDDDEEEEHGEEIPCNEDQKDKGRPDQKEQTLPVLSFSHFRQQVNRIYTSTGWQSFFQFVGLRGPRCKEDMAQLLRRHVKNSRRKKYHKAGMDFSRVQASGTSKILSKGQKYSASSELRTVEFHDSWNFKGGTKFLDATCLLYHDKKLVETVDYMHRVGGDGAVQHSGDMMRDGGGTHTIRMNLFQLRPEITSCVFVISAWSGAKLSDILSPSISFVDAEADTTDPLCVYHLDSEDKVDHLTSVIMCKLYRTRTKGAWHVQAIGDAHRGDASNYDPIYKAVQSLV